MDFGKLTDKIPPGAKDELLKKVDDLKSTINDKFTGKYTESSSSADASTRPEPGVEVEPGTSDQFAQSRKFESTTRGEAGTDSATEVSDAASDEDEVA